MERDRDDQPGSPWRAEDDQEALTASGAWPTSLDAARGRRGLEMVRETLDRAQPPEPKQSLRQRELQRRSASG